MFSFFQNIVDTLRNIFKIPELRDRILFTLSMILLYRLGSFVVLPGVNPLVMQQMFEQQQGSGILGMINTFVGGAFSRGSIMALGIMPYISASIIIQLLQAALPTLQRMQKEGETGRRKINQLTRYLTVVITAAQSVGYLVNMNSQFGQAIMDQSAMFWVQGIFILTAGTMFLVWLGERITDKGIGNGISLIIAVGIIAQLPTALFDEITTNPIMIFYLELISLGIVTMGVVALTVAVRKIPVNYARRMMGNKMMGGMMPTVRQYIPLKLNAANVMPIIFAQALMFLPASVAQFFPQTTFFAAAGSALSDWTSVTYNVIFALLIILFTYFYTSLTVNPSDIADELKRSGGFIPGVKPGKQTSEYIDTILTRITLPGSIFLAIVAVIPAVAATVGVSNTFARFYGGTSLLIMIGVVLDTLQQVNSYLTMRHYDGLMKTGRMSRTQQSAMVSQ